MPSNLPDPDKIPDMSLDGPTPTPAPAPPSASPSGSIQPLPAAPPAAKPLPAPPPEQPPDWQEGDSVLAPWEPIFLYPGTIRQILADEAKGDQALIAYDDGGEGWVFVYSLCPFEFKKGQRVQVRRRDGPNYVAGEIRKVGDEDVEVRFETGETEWTPMRTLRLPCIENGPPAVPTKLAPWQGAPPAAEGTGIPSWAIWVGVAILLAVFRVGCRSMMQN